MIETFKGIALGTDPVTGVPQAERSGPRPLSPLDSGPDGAQHRCVRTDGLVGTMT